MTGHEALLGATTLAELTAFIAMASEQCEGRREWGCNTGARAEASLTTARFFETHIPAFLRIPSVHIRPTVTMLKSSFQQSTRSTSIGAWSKLITSGRAHLGQQRVSLTTSCIPASASASTNPAMAAAATAGASRAMEELNWDNSSLRTLFVDRSGERHTRTVRHANFSTVNPEPVDKPQLLCVSEEALALLDIGPEQVQHPEFVQYFSGNKVLPGAEPAAHCYCGHQFGLFSGQLGDGAAMYLGEVVNQAGERWELQFKGAGPTPYSRAADGRKVLRSSVREFLCSEAMYHLGIPTTRAGTCITSDSRIMRDPLYNGNAIMERCTIITRIAPTFLRFGSFEIFKPTDSITGRTGPSAGLEADMLPTMLRFTLQNYFPELWARHNGDALMQQYPRGDEAGWHDLYRDWLKEVAVRTASMVAGWMSVGWAHGVLNTDNMSIIGVTIDYGPFGFMDAYNPEHVPNGSDDSGRYNFSAQPDICRWNIEKLGEAVRWAVPERIAREAVDAYDKEYARSYTALMRRKLGLTKVQDDGDAALVQDLLKLMAEAGSDWTNTWRVLSRLPMPDASHSSFSGSDSEQVLQYLLAQGLEPKALAALKDTVIPASNLQMLVTLATKDPNTLHALGTNAQQIYAEAAKAKEALRLRRMSPEEKEATDKAAWQSWLQRYAARLAREAAAGLTQQERVATMNSTNPRYVLRNWMAQEAIEKADKGDFSEVRALLDLLRDPFTSQGEDAAFHAVLSGEAPAVATTSAGASQAVPVAADDYSAATAGPAPEGPACKVVGKYDRKPPAWAAKLCVTCSS